MCTSIKQRNQTFSESIVFLHEYFQKRKNKVKSKFNTNNHNYSFLQAYHAKRMKEVLRQFNFITAV